MFKHFDAAQRAQGGHEPGCCWPAESRSNCHSSLRPQPSTKSLISRPQRLKIFGRECRVQAQKATRSPQQATSAAASGALARP